MEQQPGWAEWSALSKRVVLIVRYEAPASEEGEWELAVPMKQLNQLKQQNIVLPPSLCTIPTIEPIPESEIKEWTERIPDFAQIDTTPFANKSNRMLSVLENISTQLECPELYRLIENKLKSHS